MSDFLQREALAKKFTESLKGVSKTRLREEVINQTGLLVMMLDQKIKSNNKQEIIAHVVMDCWDTMLNPMQEELEKVRRENAELKRENEIQHELLKK